MRIVKYLVTATLATVSVLLVSEQTLARQTPESPEVVINRWVEALDAHNSASALALLADEPFLIVDSTTDSAQVDTYEGKEKIAAVLEQYEREGLRVSFEETPTEQNGTISWVERRQSSANSGTGTGGAQDYLGQALVVDGKIKSISYSPASPTPAEGEGDSDQGNAVQVPGDSPRAGGILVELGGLVILLVTLLSCAIVVGVRQYRTKSSQGR